MKKQKKTFKQVDMPKPASPPPDFVSAIIVWADSTLNPRAGFYAGRGPKTCDLNSKHLERIYQGIHKDFSPQHAECFVEFVDNLTDLSASAFLVAFESFWSNGCADPVAYTQQPVDGYNVSAQDDEGRLGEGMGSILNAISESRSPEEMKWESESIKRPFLTAHGKKSPNRRSNNWSCSGPFWD